MQKVTPNEALRIFISSTITDLGPERLAVKEVVEELQLNPILAEGLGARPETPREVTLSLVRQSDIYIGLFWQRYGEVSSGGLSATEEEYQEARAFSKPILIYIKEPAPNRDKLLARFLSELEQYDRGHLRTTFATMNELRGNVKRDIMREVSKLAKGARMDGTPYKMQTTSMGPKQEEDVYQQEGILGLLRNRIMRRVTEQLDPSVKRYKTMDAVEQGARALASKIKGDKFVPDIVLGWRGLDRIYQGSEIVANLLAEYLGAPLRIIDVEEIGETRQVAEDCHWLKGLGKVLIVDDACYSGSTLRAIQEKLKGVNPTVELRFAVLTTLEPDRLPNLYYVTVHNTEELLFPWGWSRLIVGFYDIYKLFGISDRRVVSHEATDWGLTDTIAKEHIGSVRLLTIESRKEMQQEPNGESDIFLYFLSGPAEVHIGDKAATFFPGEYIFIPRGIGYSVSAKDTVQVLELLSGAR